MSSDERATSAEDYAEGLRERASKVMESDTSVEEPDALSADEEMSLDLVFTVLKNQRRRYVLQYLVEHGGPVSLGDLSEHIAGKENDKPPRAVSSQERKRAYVGLYQSHLPMMDDAGVIEFNKDRGYVELSEPRASMVGHYLGTADSSSRPWPAYYLSLAAVGIVLTIACVLTALPVLAVALAQAVAFGAVAGVHARVEDSPLFG